MLKKCLRIALFLVVSQVAMAQEFDYGKVSKLELEEKTHPIDSSASAAFLFKQRTTFFQFSDSEGFQVVTEIYERIKIYDKEGFDYATKQVNLYRANQGNKEKFTGLKAASYNLVKGKIEESKLKKDGIFETELSDYYDQTKFTMPNVKEGTVVEYKYRITSPFIYNVDEYVMQENVPINKIEASFSAPEFYNFKINVKGYLSVSPVKTTNRKTIISSGADRSGNVTSFNANKLEYIDHIHTYTLANVPAMREEPYVNNIDNYRSTVKYELSYVKYPNSIPKYYSTTWEDVVKSIYDNPRFGEELNKNGYYEDDIDVLIEGVTDPANKLALLFNYVKSRVKWNGYYGYNTNLGVRKAYKEQTGNIADVNLMLTSMLRYAGLDANPILVSTRGNGVAIFPTREGYNYVIAGINIGNSLVLLDASDTNSLPNVLPVRALNWRGRMIKKGEESLEVNLYPNALSSETKNVLANLQEDASLTGMIRNVKTLHDAKLYRDVFNGADEDNFIEKLENKYEMEIEDFKVDNAKELEMPITETFKFVKENQADIIGDKIYFSPLFFLRTAENPFKMEKREFPIDFGYPSENTYRVMVNLPEGYKVASLPEAKSMSLPENLGSFMFTITENGKQVQLLVRTTMNNALITPVYYDVLKEYFKQLIEKENEKVVLIKV
ncbi:DUF3857 domain-containing protein [Cellulophaga sp. F20128]|uniref:DUF3857 domain-containing protein n=1 Tax=Cellulophaga sp. F20128 TaxID=2926413 RepID=UPI001FF4A420|nr:DUF3857 domain-containing protein [Cellulophaga sp. F20128]MCK0156054.1 DUF3857 domain-containing protein [Cellulophaga sp. F20128]